MKSLISIATAALVVAVGIGCAVPPLVEWVK